MRVTVLGSGTSHGIPSVGCSCATCLSPDPRDRRWRSSIAVQWRGKSLVVDTPPELRLHALRSHIRRIDALFYTHSHADHLFGLDDVRRYNDMQKSEMPIFARPDVLEDIRRAFRYVFVTTQVGGGKPRLALTEIESDSVEWAGLRVEAIPILHGRLPILGYRFGRYAHITDASAIPLESMDRLRGLHTLTLGALRWEAHPTHFNIPQALEVVRELKPERTFFTHISHEVSHADTEARLPAGVRLAYDGLHLAVPETD